MSIAIIPIQTGTGRVRPSQARGVGHGLRRITNVFRDHDWTPELPLLAWAIVHPDGVIVVDTGETARAMQPGYYPAWHPYFRYALRVQVTPEDEIGPQLARHGIAARDVRTVLMTHLHTDHAGGVHHFPQSAIWAHAREWRDSRGVAGRVRSYLPQHWPSWFAPQAYTFDNSAVGPFVQSQRITADGAVCVVPTPGHTPGHVSVIVRAHGIHYFLSGDAAYSEAALLDEAVDGVSLDEAVSRRTLRTIGAFVRDTPTVFLPSHDLASVARLQSRTITHMEARA